MDIDFDTALHIGRNFVKENVEPGIGQPVVVTAVMEYPTCWVVGFQTKAYWETRVVRHALAGGGPLIIDKATGELTLAASAIPLGDQIPGEEISSVLVAPPPLGGDE